MKVINKKISLVIIVVVAFSILLGGMGLVMAQGYGLSSVSGTQGLVKDSPQQVIGRIIQWVIGLVGALMVVMLVWGGIAYMTAAGNQENLAKAKKILTGAFIGIIIVALAFAITRFVLQALFSNTSGTGSTPSTQQTQPSQTNPGQTQPSQPSLPSEPDQPGTGQGGSEPFNEGLGDEIKL